MGAFVGIDLGTTFSVVAYIDTYGKPQCIRNEYGSVTNPSVVYLGAGGPLVGEEAKERQANGDPDVASFFKRSMGDANFILEFQGKSYTPVDLSALVLAKLKRIAEAHLGQPVTQAVVTVPAYFNNSQREATIQAGKQAGLDVLAIISEPTAAALAYGMRPTQGEQTVLVYDLGGGTFDVSVVRISPTEQRVIGTGGDHTLGGKDWDDRIFNFLLLRFQQEYGIELVGDDINELLVLSENVKKSLSTRSSVEVRVQGGGHTGVYTLTRDDYENMTIDLMERTQRLTEQTLEEINLTWKKIDHVLLVGGSTRMPIVRKYVERMSGKPASAALNPDEAVALGAAIQAAMEMERLNPNQPVLALSGRKKSVDVMSHSLGMIAINDKGTQYINSILIRKNQPIPCTETRPYTLQLSQRRENKLEVFLTQAESADPRDCAYLGRYVFSDIPAVKDKKAVLDISYAYDKNGVVDISAVERSTRKKLTISVEKLPEDIPHRFTLPPQQAAAEREFLTVYMAFDLSGSMSGEPIAEAQKAARAFLQQMDLASSSIGLISFSDSVSLTLKASQNAKEIERGISSLSVGSTGYGNSGHPFDELYRLLQPVKGLRYGLVLADGMWSDQHVAVQQAKTCHKAWIEIIGIGFGDVDRKFMRDISSSDENAFLTNMNQLVETFSSIAQELTEGRAPRGGKGFLRL